ncbi:MAG: nucleotidyl transferase AbiEii/AbiGii toxin family protein [Deltaproteobacteria bacterium]|nr:nucleotidyl transferase AbiEii/AbiGii toxin family protein [Deltaproteobacteria bacterium]
MPSQLELLTAREEEVRKLVEWLGNKTNGFEDPKLVLIGGYALRAYIPFSRATRDCDFVLEKGEPWHIDTIKRLLPRGMSISSEEKRGDYAFLRCLKIFRVGRLEAKISLDFMESKVISRTTNQEVLINQQFLDASAQAAIPIGAASVQVYVPTYTDYLLLKIVSARASDVRDIATLVWKNGIPTDLETRAAKLRLSPEVVKKDLRNIIAPALEDRRFLHSWRGMFITKDFTEETKEEVLRQLRQLMG